MLDLPDAQKTEFFEHLDVAKAQWTTQHEKDVAAKAAIQKSAAVSFKPSVYYGKTHTALHAAIQDKCQGEHISCVPLVQSSGWGKTRSLIQLAVSNLCHIIYLHINLTGTNGYPCPVPFTQLAAITAKPNHGETYVERVRGFAHFYAQQLRVLAHLSLKTSFGTPSELFKMMYRWGDNDGVFEYSDAYKDMNSNDTSATMPDDCPLWTSYPINASGQLPVLIVALDEAARLNADGMKFREGINDIGKTVLYAARRGMVTCLDNDKFLPPTFKQRFRVVVVPTSTTSSMTPLLHATADLSGRLTTTDLDTQRATSNAVVLSTAHQYDVMDHEPLKRYFLPQSYPGERRDAPEMVRLGRPLWMHNGIQADVKISVKFAMEKLSCSKDPFRDWDSAKFASIALAIVGALCGGFTQPHFRSSELIEKHMCTALSMSRDGSSEGHYVSEPVLAAGAREYLRELNRTGISQEDALLHVIKQLDDIFSIAPTHRGDVGELLCGLMLLECMEFTCGGIPYYPVVTAREFMKNLIGVGCGRSGSGVVGGTSVTEDDLNEDFPNDVVLSFNHVAHYSKDAMFHALNVRGEYEALNRSKLEALDAMCRVRSTSALHRCAMVQARTNEPNCDFLLPTYNIPSGCPVAHAGAVSESSSFADHTGYIDVQTKAANDNKYEISWIQNAFKGTCHVMIVMVVGAAPIRTQCFRRSELPIDSTLTKGSTFTQVVYVLSIENAPFAKGKPWLSRAISLGTKKSDGPHALHRYMIDSTMMTNIAPRSRMAPKDAMGQPNLTVPQQQQQQTQRRFHQRRQRKPRGPSSGAKPATQ